MLLAAEVRQLEVAHLHQGEGANGGERGVQASEQPWELELEGEKVSKKVLSPRGASRFMEIWIGICPHISSSRSAPMHIPLGISHWADATYRTQDQFVIQRQHQAEEEVGAQPDALDSVGRLVLDLNGSGVVAASGADAHVGLGVLTHSHLRLAAGVVVEVVLFLARGSRDGAGVVAAAGGVRRRRAHAQADALRFDVVAEASHGHDGEEKTCEGFMNGGWEEGGRAWRSRRRTTTIESEWMKMGGHERRSILSLGLSLLQDGGRKKKEAGSEADGEEKRSVVGREDRGLSGQ